jgi:hypothetical protein
MNSHLYHPAKKPSTALQAEVLQAVVLDIDQWPPLPA